MTFHERRSWNHPELTRRLHVERRFNRITVEYFLNMGAQLFAWILPNESVDGSDAESDWPHGAFVYLFHEDPYDNNERDCYFAVSDNSLFAKMLSGDTSRAL